jgi:hypothetical protein
MLAHGKYLTRLVAAGMRARVNLDLSVHQADDPVHRDATAALDAGHRAVFIQAGIGDFDDHRDVGGFRLWWV